MREFLQLWENKTKCWLCDNMAIVTSTKALVQELFQAFVRSRLAVLLSNRSFNISTRILQDGSVSFRMFKVYPDL